MTTSVIIPCGRAGGLETVLRSLERQTQKPDEVVIVLDRIDARDAGIPEHVELPLRLIHVTRGGVVPPPAYAPATVLNIGAFSATGDTLLFLHDMTIVHPNWLRAHTEEQARHESPIVVGKCCSHTGGFETPGEHQLQPWSCHADHIWHIVELFNFSIQRDLFHKANGFCELFDGDHGYLDSDLARRVSILTGKLPWVALRNDIRICRLTNRTGIVYPFDTGRSKALYFDRAVSGALYAERPYTESTFQSQYHVWRSVPGWFDPSEAGLLVSVVEQTPNDATLLEIGTWCGRSAACVAAWTIASKRQLYTVDSYPDASMAAEQSSVSPQQAARIAQGVLGQFPNVHMINADSLDGIEAVAQRAGKIHCAFIDGHHSREQVSAELNKLIPHMAPTSFVTFHDWNQPWGVSEAANAILPTSSFMLDGVIGGLAAWSRR